MSGHDPAAERAASARHISGMPAVEYHAMHALSASGAWLLAVECAAKFLWRSPWNPLYAPEAKTEFDIGVAAHLAVLEPGRQADSIAVIEAGDYRSSKARLRACFGQGAAVALPAGYRPGDCRFDPGASDRRPGVQGRRG